MSMRRGFCASGISRTRSTCKQAVFERGARHDDMIGELEPALESSRRDPLMQEFATGLFLSRLLRAANRQRVLTRLDREILARETRDRERHPIGVLAGALDVIRRVIGSVAPSRRSAPNY